VSNNVRHIITLLLILIFNIKISLSIGMLALKLLHDMHRGIISPRFSPLPGAAGAPLRVLSAGSVIKPLAAHAFPGTLSFHVVCA
jgi:hypothetical protein